MIMYVSQPRSRKEKEREKKKKDWKGSFSLVPSVVNLDVITGSPQLLCVTHEVESASQPASSTLWFKAMPIENRVRGKSKFPYLA